MVFGGWTRTAATARPHHLSDGKNRWVTETDADAQRGHNTHCVGRVSVASVGLEKARLSGGECSHRRPTGDQDSLCRTGEDGKVKFWSGCLAVIQLVGVPAGGRPLAGRLSPTSDGGFNNCRVGRVSLAEHGTLKDKIVWPGLLSPASVGRSGLAESDGLDRRAEFRGRKASQSTGSVVG